MSIYPDWSTYINIYVRFDELQELGKQIVHAFAASELAACQSYYTVNLSPVKRVIFSSKQECKNLTTTTSSGFRL